MLTTLTVIGVLLSLLFIGLTIYLAYILGYSDEVEDSSLDLGYYSVGHEHQFRI